MSEVVRSYYDGHLKQSEHLIFVAVKRHGD